MQHATGTEFHPTHSANTGAVTRFSVEIAITEPTQVGEARRKGQSIAASIGLSESQIAKAGIVINELATNLIKHAEGGCIVLNRDSRGIEIVAIDRGPGIANLGQCMADGYSTTGTAGTGLGAISRQADECDVFSAPGLGTIVYTRFGQPAAPAPLRIGGICLPLEGEHECGDGWDARFTEAGTTIAIIDGLGHGPSAATAARRALELFHGQAERTPVQTLQACHAALRSTRGAAMGVARVDLGAGIVSYGGIGNTVAVTQRGNEHRRMISYEGTLGLQARKFQELSYPFTRGGLLILHTDGIGTQWDLSKYPGIAQRHPTVISALILREFRRQRDDATVITFSWGHDS